MPATLFIPENYESRFGLLGTFCAQFAAAARGLGLTVNPHPDHLARTELRGDDRPVFVMFNQAPSPDTVSAWMAGALPRASRADSGVEPTLVQWLVDHPLHASESFIDTVSRRPGYKLACVAEDDLHMVSLRWPRVHRLRLWHGVPESAILSTDQSPGGDEPHAERDIDVLMAGSIASPAELDRFRAEVPAPLHRPCEELVRLRLGMPWMSFGQAFDMTMPASLQCDAAWALLSAVFRYTTAALNRERRVRLLRGLDGLSVTVAGGAAWAPICEGLRAVRHVGEVPYHDLPSWMKRTKVCAAVNPTQFVHAFSERLLLGLAGGAACVSDDRLWVRHEFASCTKLFPSHDAGALRAHVEALLRDGTERASLGAAGVKAVREKHLWRHRVTELITILSVV